MPTLIGPNTRPSLGQPARFLFAPGWKGRDNKRPWRRRFLRAATAQLLPRCARLVRRLQLSGLRRRPLPPRRCLEQAQPSCKELGWGGNPSPAAPVPLDASSIPTAASAGSPQGLTLSEPPLPCAARRPLPLSPGAATTAAAATEQTRPAPRARGGGSWYWGRHPLRGWRRIFCLTHSALRFTVRAISFPSPLAPGFQPVSHLYVPWRQALKTKISVHLAYWRRAFILASGTKAGIYISFNIGRVYIFKGQNFFF